MFVVGRGRTGRIVVHRFECALVDPAYYDDAELEAAATFEKAMKRALELSRPSGRTPSICGWCRPKAMG